MANEKASEGRTPPYLPFPRFESFIAGLKGKVLPPRFDRTLVQRMSGAEQSQLGIALKYFDLVEGEDRRFTPRMKRLVSSHGSGSGAEWGDVLLEMLGSYDAIDGQLEEAATMGQLTEAFRERGGLSGSALAKAIRFYLSMARAAGKELSPHFTAPSVASSPATGDRPKRAARPRRPREDGEEKSHEGSPPPGTKHLRFTVPSGDIQVWLPAEVTSKELGAFANYLASYVEMSRPD